MAWNVLLTFEEPRYENVVVLDKDSIVSGARHRTISYFFTVETQDGKRLRATTYGGLYGQVDPGDEVILRWDTSALEITYYQIQSKDTGEKQ